MKTIGTLLASVALHRNDNRGKAATIGNLAAAQPRRARTFELSG
ncbi:MAG: hypothetical protein ACLPZ0_21755 [Steroidobacteraceae bacterium]